MSPSNADRSPPPSPPRVLFVANPGPLGGSNVSLLGLFRGLGRRVHKVVFAPDGPFVQSGIRQGLIDEWIGGPTRGSGRVDRLLRALWLMGWTVRNRGSITAIHANALTGLFLITPAAFASRTKVVLWVHNPAASAWDRRLGRISRRLIRRLTVAAVSETALRVAVESGVAEAEEVRVIPNPIDFERVLAERRPHDAIRVAFLGGDTRRKGFDILPRVIAACLDLDVEWHLYINRSTRSDSDAWTELDQLPKDRVNMHGRRTDVREIYGNADVVFAPSTAESFGLAVVEAMANGIPVVASNILAFEDLVGHEQAGLTFESGDPDAAAAAIRRLVSDESLRFRLGASGRERVSKLTPDLIGDQLIDLYVG